MDKRRVLEFGRRVYGEVVKGRTRVRVISESELAQNATTPRFLLSPYRSGTTLFRYCLDSHPDLAVPPETDFMAPLMTVLKDGPSMTGLDDLGYGSEAVDRKLGNFARTFLDTYALSKSAGLGWLDKSPRYAESPDELRRLFPAGRYVAMHRHPLDQIHSFTKGGYFVHPAIRSSGVGDASPGSHVVQAAACYWANVTAKMIDFAGRGDDTLAITYEELCARPEAVLRAVLNHLDLPWDSAVLNYHEHDHDLGREAGRVAGTVGFSASSGGWQEWPTGWAEAVWEEVAPVAEPLGYRREGGLARVAHGVGRGRVGRDSASR